MNVNIDDGDQKKLLSLLVLLEQRLGIEVSFSQLLGWLLNVGGGVLSGKMIFVPVEDHDRDASECAALERAELTAAISSIASKLVPGFKVFLDDGPDEIVIVCTLDKGKATGNLAASRNGSTQH